MRDGRAIRRLRASPGGIDMNPLLVLCQGGKAVDPLLAHLEPAADAGLLPHQPLQFIDSANDPRHSVRLYHGSPNP